MLGNVDHLAWVRAVGSPQLLLLPGLLTVILPSGPFCWHYVPAVGRNQGRVASKRIHCSQGQAVCIPPHQGSGDSDSTQSFVPASAVTMKEDEGHLGWRTPLWPGQMASVSWPHRDQDSPHLPQAPGSYLSKRVSVACGAQLGGDNPTFPTEALRLQTQPLCSHLVSQRCPP